MKFGVLGALLASGLVQATSFRDSDGWLELPDCRTAKAWRASATAPRDGDGARLLSAAYRCATAGDADEARALQALADALPRSDHLFGTDGDNTRVRILLALGDLDAAATLMRRSSETLLDGWSTIEDPASVMHMALAMQSLNNQIAMDLRATDPARSVAHQLLAARAYDLPDLGMPEMATLYRNVALEVAIKSGLAAPLIAASEAILARPADELTEHQAKGITLAALALVDLQRSDDAARIAERLKASGQPDAVRNADNVIQHIARSR